MILRIFASLLILLSILYMPFWLSVLLALIAMIYFSFFWESVILFFTSDLLYGIKETKFFGIFFISSIISFLILIMIEVIKKRIRISA